MRALIGEAWERLVPWRQRQRLAAWWGVARGMGRSAGRYRRLLFADLAGFAFTSGVVIVLYVGVLYGLRFWWAVFRETSVGEMYLGFFIERAAFIDGFLAQPLWRLALEIYGAVAVAGLAIGGVGSFLHLKRYLYDFASCPTRLVAWGGPTLLAAAMWVADEYGVDLQTALMVCALPALGMFAHCLALASRLAPEAGACGRWITRSGPWRRMARRWPWRP